MLAYARQAKNRQLEIDASEIRFRAERRLGELIVAHRKLVGLAKGGQPYRSTGSEAGPVERPPTLAEAGIDKKLSALAQKYAGISAEDFEEILANRRHHIEHDNARVTVDLFGPSKVYRSVGAGDFEWHTPPEYIDLARRVLGEIDLDPASSDIAQQTVRAKRYFTLADDGARQPWEGRVWLNPPFARPGIRDFTDKLLAEWASGRISAALMLTHAYTDSGWFTRVAREATAIAFPTKRVRFIGPSGGALDTGGPITGQSVFYFGPDLARFAEVFGKVGVVVRGWREAS
jgi:hypothetical protein